MVRLAPIRPGAAAFGPLRKQHLYGTWRPYVVAHYTLVRNPAGVAIMENVAGYFTIEKNLVELTPPEMEERLSKPQPLPRQKVFRYSMIAHRCVSVNRSTLHSCPAFEFPGSEVSRTVGVR